MNCTTNGTTSSTTTSCGGGFALVFGLAIGCLSLISIIALASCFCTRKKMLTVGNGDGGSISTEDSDQDHSVILEMGGLDEATLDGYPKLLYSQAKAKQIRVGDGPVESCCSICLADYKEQDMLRHLPDCGHLFHIHCIDPWLKLHPSCPICRKLAVQSPRFSVTGSAPTENRQTFYDSWFVQLLRQFRRSHNPNS